MADGSFRVYVYSKKVDRTKLKKVRSMLAEKGIDIYYKYDFDGEVTYVSERLDDSPRNHERIDSVESGIRAQFDDRAVKRDKRNASPGAPGIDGVSYVTGIVVGFGN